MAGSLLLLLDDIAAVLDDVSVMTKVAAKKTAGVLGDDLALNAEQVSGSASHRELPIVWAVAKGSFWNKVILVPLFLALSYFLPFMIGPVLIVGGAFLAFEGVEKVLHSIHKMRHKHDATHSADTVADVAFDEKGKIKGAIRTDFILSAEIIAISLGSMSHEPILKQAIALAIISIVFTAGVYGLVAGIVKMDDVGFWLKHKPSAIAQKFGGFLINSTPYLMRFLTIAGTAAMFLVGGSIIVHNIPFLAHISHELDSQFAGIMKFLVVHGLDVLVGAIIGGIIVWVVNLINSLRGTKAAH